MKKTNSSLRPGRTALLLFLLAAAVLLPHASRAADMVVMSVVLNQEEQGDRFFLMTPERDVFLSPADLRDMGLEEIPPGAFVTIDGDEYVRLRSFEGVDYEVVEDEAVLRVTAEPDLFARYVADLSYRSPVRAEKISSSAAFVNYTLNYNADDEFNFTSLSVPWEVGLNIKDFFAFSSFTYTRTDTEERLTRLLTNVTRDDPGRLRRYIVGDFFANSGPLGGGGAFGGLSVSSRFSIRPFFVSSPGLDVSGVADTPSEVDVYVNDTLVKSVKVAPGEFELNNVMQLSGAGDSKVVITDAFGREETVESSYYLSSALLKPGLHSYSYNLGFKRNNFGTDSFEYGGPAFLGYHDYGLTRGLTVGLRGESDGETTNAGSRARFVLWRLGEVDASAAASLEDGEFGYGGSLSYLYATSGFSLRGSVAGFSKGYATLNTSSFQDKSRLEWSAGAGVSLGGLGSVSGNYRVRNRYFGADTRTASLYYSKRLFRTLNLNVIAARTSTAEDLGGVTESVFATLSYFFADTDSASLNYRVEDGRTTESVNYQRNPTFGTGLSYNLFAERQEDASGKRELGGSAFVQYRGDYGIYSVNYRRVFGKSSYTLSTSGALAFVGGSVHPTRPINDSFALVRVKDFEGVTVKYNNQRMGRTNRSGEILIPELISYYPNSFSFDADDLPLNYEVGSTTKHATTSFRGAGVVEFNARKVQAVTGRFYVSREGAKREAEYAGLRVYAGTETFETRVGVGGEFYLENIPAGTHPARLAFGEHECETELTVPESEDIFLDIGEVICEMD